MGTANYSPNKQELVQSGEYNLSTHTRNRVELYGFESYLFRIVPQYGNIQTDSKTLTNHPNEFVKVFDASCLNYKNPIENHFKKSIAPLIWDQQLFSETPELNEASRSYGVNFGWSLSTHDAKGTTSILSLTRRSAPVSPQEFSNKIGDLMWLCHQLHTSMSETLSANKIIETNNRLSVRELEILKWTAQGKTASDIGMILNLTTRTVNFHISSAMRKMGATNKTSAVVIAAKCGLL
ncbi:LuxR C-terminal-related transcriptional regulator [Pseudomonas sp. SIMBA_077]